MTRVRRLRTVSPSTPDSQSGVLGLYRISTISLLFSDNMYPESGYSSITQKDHFSSHLIETNAQKVEKLSLPS